MTSTRWRKRILAVHIAFWLVYASFFFYQISSGRRVEQVGWGIIIYDFLFHIVTMMGIGYLNYFVFMPRLLHHKNIGRYILEFLPVFLIIIIGVILGKQYINDGFSHEIGWLYSSKFIFNVILSAFFLAMFVGLFKLVEDYIQLEARKQELENESLVSELRFLKAQINPHFLFNTLNNLYYLAHKNSPQTPEVIAKLSQMMRYMLYDTNHTLVPIKKEIEYMENYISLEKLRLSKIVPIKFEVHGDLESVRITPLILITFLENAIKHGINNNAEDSWIDIDLSLMNGQCIYTVSNSKVPDSKKTVHEKSGIGLQNVQRRLDLSYPDKYKLETEDTEQHYWVKLTLDLSLAD